MTRRILLFVPLLLWHGVIKQVLLSLTVVTLLPIVFILAWTLDGLAAIWKKTR